MAFICKCGATVHPFDRFKFVRCASCGAIIEKENINKKYKGDKDSYKIGSVSYLDGRHK